MTRGVPRKSKFFVRFLGNASRHIAFFQNCFFFLDFFSWEAGFGGLLGALGGLIFAGLGGCWGLRPRPLCGCGPLWGLILLILFVFLIVLGCWWGLRPRPLCAWGSKGARGGQTVLF